MLPKYGGTIMTIYLLIFAFILFLGVKIAPKGNFNEDFLSLKVSKGIQGFWAVCIIAHHFVQPFVYSGQGAGALSIFALIGFLFVGVFFFFSGYGLFKSYKNKPNYLNGFLRKRIPVVLVPLYVVNTILTAIVLHQVDGMIVKAIQGKKYYDVELNKNHSS